MDRMNREPASFGAALREAAESFAVPQAEELHERAVRRGRQLRRRRVAGTSVSAAAVVAAVGALTFGLLGTGSPAGTPTASASGPLADSQVGGYLADHFQPLFPPGAQLSTSSGQPALQGYGYGVLDPTGQWQAEAGAFVTDAGHQYAMELQVKREPADPHCQTPPSAGYQCTSKPLGSGTLVTTIGPGINGSGSWDYAWALGDGRSVELAVTQFGPLQAPASYRDPYTQQQAEQVLTAPAWTRVVDGLPQIVDCAGGLKSVQTDSRLTGWSCASTGRTYPNAFELVLAD